MLKRAYQANDEKRLDEFNLTSLVFVFVRFVFGFPPIFCYVFGKQLIHHNVNIEKLGFQNVCKDCSYALTKYEPVASHGGLV